VRLHAPTKGWFTASLIIALIAVISALSPMPYLTSYGTWVAILAYVVGSQSATLRQREILPLAKAVTNP
jgi:hypothetical protein